MMNTFAPPGRRWSFGLRKPLALVTVTCSATAWIAERSLATADDEPKLTEIIATDVGSTLVLIGKLGRPIGETVVIVGHKGNDDSNRNGSDFVVDSVNGKPLDTRVTVSIVGIEMWAPGTPAELRGHEQGEFAFKEMKQELRLRFKSAKMSRLEALKRESKSKKARKTLP